jgi:hypothetical protein
MIWLRIGWIIPVFTVIKPGRLHEGNIITFFW